MKPWIACLVLLLEPCGGQQSLETKYRTGGAEVVSAFEEVREVLQSSSALIMDGRTEALYGVVVSVEGHVLTKASDFRGLAKPEVVIGKTVHSKVGVVAEDPIWDVVLLKCDAAETVPVVYAEGEPGHGTWVVVNGASSRFRRRALVGMISANAREIPVRGGAALGVVLKPGDDRLVVDSVQEGSGAAKAGLQPGDRLLSLGGKKVLGMDDVKEAMKDRKAGEVIVVEVQRGKQEQEFEVELASKAEMFRAAGSMDRNDMMSGDFSTRRSGFPRVLQHDVIANSKSMGGPVLDLDGKCVGMNIARANRAETFAIPARELRGIVDRLIQQPGD